MADFSETELRQIIRSGETTIVELKVAVPRHVAMAERMCGMAKDIGGEVMPVERFEPSTLAGSVFETDAYTVPPHRLDKRFQELSSSSST